MNNIFSMSTSDTFIKHGFRCHIDIDMYFAERNGLIVLDEITTISYAVTKDGKWLEVIYNGETYTFDISSFTTDTNISYHYSAEKASKFQYEQATADIWSALIKEWHKKFGDEN